MRVNGPNDEGNTFGEEKKYFFLLSYLMPPRLVS